MAERLLPGALWKPISYRLDAPLFRAPPLGYIVHVPVSNGSLFNYFNGLRSPGRKFCTAWIGKDGRGEQYQSLDRQAWAQADGNATYWSFEVEGFPTEPMTGPQLDTLATWHRFLDVEDRIATAPGQSGIGTHAMGGNAWGGHNCPGTIRTAQLPQILDRLKGDFLMALSDTEQQQLYDRATNASVMAQAASVRTQRIEAALRALASSLPTATAKAVTDALNAGYDATVTLTPKES